MRLLLIISLQHSVGLLIAKAYAKHFQEIHVTNYPGLSWLSVIFL